jgi:chromate reductase, NAD(P)H dehydrogenase (quinone)
MSISRKKILMISGSTRKNSTNETILRSIIAMYGDRLDFELYLDIASLPHFNPDSDKEDVNLNVKRFRESIESADGVIICTPEYVRSLPGTLKNAIDWTVSTTVFSDKPAAIIVASTGGEKAFESLEIILRTLGARLAEGSRLLLQGARSKVRRIDGSFDENSIKEIGKVVDSLLAAMI